MDTSNPLFQSPRSFCVVQAKNEDENTQDIGAFQTSNTSISITTVLRDIREIIMYIKLSTLFFPYIYKNQ